MISAKCSRISAQDAMNYVGGYTLALDMTARDKQEELKKKGQPWELAKAFDTSCPVSKFIEKSRIPGHFRDSVKQTCHQCFGEFYKIRYFDSKKELL